MIASPWLARVAIDAVAGTASHQMQYEKRWKPGDRGDQNDDVICQERDDESERATATREEVT